MDTVLAINNITTKGYKCSKELCMKILPYINNFKDINFHKIKSNNKHIPDYEYLNGNELFSLIIPIDVSYERTHTDEDNVIIVKGNLLQGRCNKTVSGTSSGSIIHIIKNDYDKQFINNFLMKIQNLATIWFIENGFTVSINDCMTNKKIKNKINNIINKAKADVANIINVANANKIKKNNSLILYDKCENRIINILNTARDNAGLLATNNINNTNGIKNMVIAGSKGNNINISQIVSCVGQQNVSSYNKHGRIFFGYENFLNSQ